MPKTLNTHPLTFFRLPWWALALILLFLGLALFGEPRELFTIKLAERLFVHELGENVVISFPRFRLDAGHQAVVVKLVEDDVDGVEMTVFA